MEGLMIRLRHACIAVLFAACSPVSDSSNVPDAAVDAPNTPLMIVSSAPNNNAKSASILNPVSVFVNKKLDPATVNATTVKLRYGYAEGWYGLYGTVSYDEASLKISFVPGQPLYTGVFFEVVLDGVKSADGSETLSNQRIRFSSIVNYQKRQTSFQATGKVSSWYEYMLDMNGRQTASMGHQSAGLDGIWFTMDDPKGCCKYTQAYDAEGRNTEYRYYGNMGPDGQPWTADDVLTSFQKYNYDATSGQMTTIDVFGGGPDGVLGTADDVITAYQSYSYDSNGYVTGYFYFTSAGPDGAWHTADDRGQPNQQWGDWIVDSYGNVTKYIYRTFGADGLPKTADDVINSVSEQMYDQYGYQTRSIYYNTAGADGMWNTADDVVGGYSKTDFDADHLPIRYWNYNATSVPPGIGPDNMWFTADDVPSYLSTNSFNELKLSTEQMGYQDKGPDGVFNTADDVASYRSTSEYESNGARVNYTGYNPGPDGKYKTADDTISYKSEYDLEH
ncbi:MAG TPA: hypothetical protein VFV99_24015 [Kofleriaceae bacterium]|nr:hypothetical protein [Kofleriaceae bacterium]